MYTPKHKLSRRQMAFLLAMMISIMPFSVDAYLPALPEIAKSLQSDIHHIEKSLSAFILGVAFGQIVGGSLADVKGRRNIALAGLGIYILSSLALIFVQTDTQLLTIRIVQALGAGMSAVVVGAVVRDNYQGREAARMFALIGIITMVAPLIAPLLGAALQAIGGWRTIFVFLLLWGSLVGGLLFWLLPQRKKAEPLTGEQLRLMARRYGEVLSTRAALGFLFYQAASFASMIVFLSESPFVYMQLFGLSSQQYAWLFCGNIVTMMTFNRLTAFGLKRNWDSAHLLRAGIAIQTAANILLVVSVCITEPTLWLLAPLLMVSVGAQGLIVANTQALFMGNFKPEIGGSANAVLSAGTSLIGALVGFLATLLHNGTYYVMVLMMFATGLCGLLLLMYFSGSHLRHLARKENS